MDEPCKGTCISKIKTHYCFCKEIVDAETGSRAVMTMSILAPFDQRVRMLDNAVHSMREWLSSQEQ